MRYLVWVLRLLVFVLVLLFALKNTGPVNVHFYSDHTLADIPLIVVMLVTFVLGALFGLLLAVPGLMRRRREIRKLQRELHRLQDRYKHPVVQTQAVAPETVAPLSPL
ncbi:MAG: LapA family protein [Candidimonas sp.]|nr:MAG: LapA family protein [Candidimonas sp.]TAM19774.1 MAG: LapA family protein [Candidimonas sp.]TAM78991.1 MAG: LapA family protein [Candidimonas sp.]